MQIDENYQLKNDTFYIEVRYACTTSCLLKQNTSIFRLKERGKKLPAIDYAYSLGQYLSNVNRMSTLTILDLKISWMV